MNLRRITVGALFLLSGIIFLICCNDGNPLNYKELGHEPVIEPDYSGVTIPPNIAPLNFIIKEKGSSFNIKCTSSNGTKLSMASSDGIVRFPVKSWKKLLKGIPGGKIEIEVLSKADSGKFNRFNSFSFYVANEPMDPYLCYRLLYPGYELWRQLKIVQRCTENFGESSLAETQLLENNCINCHTFNKNNPERFLFHVRGSVGGTMIVEGNKISKRDIKTKEMNAGAVYPCWHPEGRFVVFSSNLVRQNFNAIPGKNIEVYDRGSSLILYDTEKNEIMPVLVNDTSKYMETFPEWSPDGNYLYYCRANKFIENMDLKNIKYDLVRNSFDETSMSFGKTELIFDAKAIDKSVSLPRISPDGQFLVFTLHNYGTFSIWHKEADLYLLNLNNGKVNKLSLNSDDTESYHSWSSNGKWLVFSSKRGDGLTARPYFAYFGSPENIGKPFILPQKDPNTYRKMMLTFNRPEFVTGRINLSSRDFASAAQGKAEKATWIGSKK